MGNWIDNIDLTGVAAGTSDPRIGEGIHAFKLTEVVDKHVDVGSGSQHKLFFQGEVTQSKTMAVGPAYVSLPLDGFGAKRTAATFKHMLVELLKKAKPGSDPESNWNNKVKKQAIDMLPGSVWRVQGILHRAKESGREYCRYTFHLMRDGEILFPETGDEDTGEYFG